MFQIEITGEGEDFSSILPEEIDTICRLCLKKSGTVNLFDTKNKKYIGGKFNVLLSSLSLLEVDKNDGLPQKICSACATLLNELYFFKEQINASQVILHIALGKINLQKNKITDVKINNKNEIVDQTENSIQELTYKEESNDNFYYEETENSDIEIGDIENHDYINDYVQVIPTAIPIKAEEEVSEYICKFCGETFIDRKDYLRHRKNEYKKNRKTRIPCPLCEKLIVRDRFDDHMNTHTKTRPHKCDVCNKGFSSKPNLYSHKATHREVKPHICEICGKGFVQAPSLRDHIRWHKKEYRFICDICGYTSFTKNNFWQHRRIHKSNKDYRAVSNGNQRQRKRINFYPKITYCEICERDFGTNQRLALHMYTHNGERPFLCTECGKTFTQTAHLQTHMKLHTGEKPYECPYCSKRFAVNGNLRQHIQTHTGERPYTCDVCEKSFYTNSSLRKHRKIHEKQ